MEWLAWALGLLAIYVVLAPLLLVVALFVLLTAGVVDWAGARKRHKPLVPQAIGYFGTPDKAFGWRFETRHYPSPLGPAEAWLIPATGGPKVWAIFVHGIGGTRENGYRMVEPLVAAGYPVLMITYRNDPGAPRGPDGLYSFGLAEWPDLEAAVTHALGEGAEHILLVGESMGGAIVGQYLARGRHADRVIGLALDAPALDVNEVIAVGGRRYWVPLSELVAPLGLWAWSLLRTDLRQAVSLPAIADFAGPIFVAHGTHDPLVPFSITERLVGQRPDISLFRTDAREHLMSYTADPNAYQAALATWIAAVEARHALR